jgi:SIR2-like domain
MTTCPYDLRRLYRDGRIIPFLGAGASSSVSWGDPSDRRRGPTWTEMVDQAAQLLGADYPALLRLHGTDLQILEYFKIVKGGFAPLTNWLSVKLSIATDDDILSSPIHAELVQLDRCKLFYTTNYDNFIERALRRRGRKVRVVSSEASVSHDRAADEVVKFHGDFDTPDEMVLSESQYMNRMRLESPMDFKLRADILGRAVLFIGYSFRDPNVNYIFHIVNRLLQNLPDSYTGRRAYIILSDPSEFERRLFHARNIEVVPIGGLEREKDVAAVLSQMRS